MYQKQINLTPDQVVNAFPECEKDSRRALTNVSRRIAKVRRVVTGIFANESYDENTKMFLTQAMKVWTLEPLVQQKKRIQRIHNAYLYRSGKRQKPIKKFKANTVPILSLFTPERVVHMRDKSRCRCPLHMEKTPSMYVYHKNNSFYCFGCGRGGDAISFIQQYNQVNFQEAIEYIRRCQ
jgi:hypothetical protein